MVNPRLGSFGMTIPEQFYLHPQKRHGCTRALGGLDRRAMMRIEGD